MRDLLVMGAVCVVAVVIGAGLYFYAPSSSAPQTSASNDVPQGNPVSFSVLASSSAGPQNIVAGNYHIKSANELKTLWSMIYGANSSTPPAVDFSKNDVLAVFDGTHATGGYSVAIDSIIDTNDARTVVIEHSAPGTHCQVTQGLTAPFVVVLESKSSLSLAHIDHMSVQDCP